VRCAGCPIPCDQYCRGEDVARFCELVGFDPRYREVLKQFALDGRPDLEPLIPTAVSVRLLAAMKQCPFRSVDPGCGCSGGRCALRHARPVNHRECFACIQRYG
jgi:hypothetical protein